MKCQTALARRALARKLTAIFLVLPSLSVGQVISTVAGDGAGGIGDGGVAIGASLNAPAGLAFNAAGNFYIADTGNQRIRRVAAGTAIIISIAGNGATGFSGDGGTATSASMNGPSGVALDVAGNLYFADRGNNRIRKVAAGTGMISTVAGNGATGFSGDSGPATSASLDFPNGVALDLAGNLYIADSRNHRIRKVAADTGIISTVAGGNANSCGASVDGVDGIPATSSRLCSPNSIALDLAGNLFIADTGNQRVRKVAADTGIITSIAGGGSGSCACGGIATSEHLQQPSNLAIDSAGNVYLTDVQFFPRIPFVLREILKVSVATGTITTVGGGWELPGTPDPALTLDAAGNLYYGGPNSVRKVAAESGVITAFAGGGNSLNLPTGVVLDTSGNLYIADTDNHRIRMVAADTGIVSTVAGNGEPGFAGDGGTAANASMYFPSGVAFDLAGNLYVADSGNQRIRKVAAGTGIIATIAGNGVAGFSGDGGPATSASMNGPSGVALDVAGNLYFADRGNNRIRKVSNTGIITTIAGDGMAGFSGDGGPATTARLSDPKRAAIDSAGNLYISDNGNGRIRKVAAGTAIITTVAGGGTRFGDVPAIDAVLIQPHGMAFDSAGNLYIAEAGCKIRKVTAATGIIATVSGNVIGTPSNLGCGFSGDGGPAISAMLNHPTDVALDAADNLYIADRDNNRIRKVSQLRPVDFAGQSINTTSPASTVTFTNASTGAVTITSISVSTHFAATHNCTSVAAWASCSVNVTFTPAAQGAIAGALVIASALGSQSWPLSGVGERSLVTHYYRSILRRAPDLIGKAYWDAEAARVQVLGANVNEVWFAMAGSFLSSPEYLALKRDNAGYATDLFGTFFNRAPDAAGLAYWKDQLDLGLPREVALAAFMFSTEFASFTQAIFGTTVTRKEVDTVVDFYRGFLGALPDDSGFKYWLGLFRTAQCQGGATVSAQVEAISSAFANSPQYGNRGRNNAQHLGDLYNAFLRRGGDLGGVQFWINEIATGARSRENVRQQFVASAEFQARVAAIIAQGCLP